MYLAHVLVVYSHDVETATGVDTEDGFCSVRHIEVGLQLDFAARICIKFAVSIPTACSLARSNMRTAALSAAIVNHTTLTQ